MLNSIIENIDPEKTAIIYGNFSISYGNLKLEISKRASYLKSLNVENFLLSHHNPYYNFINFLSTIAAGKKAIFGNKNLPEVTEKYLINTLNFYKLDEDIPTSEITDYKWKITTFTDRFLAVLSSGSTGEPKIIWKDYQSWFSAFEHQSSVFNINKQSKIFVLDALAYSANLNAALHGIWMGATVVLGKISEAKIWNSQFKKHDINAVFMVPSHYQLLVESQNENLKIESIVSAGEKLSPALALSLKSSFPEACITEYYGAAELGHISYIQNQDIIEKPGCVGKPFPGVKIQLINDIIHIQSTYVSPDYRIKPTVKDIGEVDKNGFLYLLGREGGLFNRRGLNIFAQEIEFISLKFAGITNAKVIIDHETNKIKLWIEIKTHVSKIHFKEHLIKHLGKSKMPNYIEFCETFPRNESGKINIKELVKIPSEEAHFID